MKNIPIKKIGLILLIAMLSSCHVGRFFFWNRADVRDYKKFPAFRIEAGKHPFQFITADTMIAPELPMEFNPEGRHKSIESFLQQEKTLAFMVIRNDTILYEKYFDGYGRSSVIPGFSIAKSVVSALLGIAIHEGFIGSVQDPVSKYLKGFRDPDIGRISLENLLNMRSGIRYNEGYLNPFGQVAKFYYGRNLDKYTYHLKTEQPPGSRYEYVSANTQILAMILEKATGRNLAEYLEEKIWKPAGMAYDASWSYDSEKHGRIKAFCCLNTRPVDLARFGRLYLNTSNNNIIPPSWIRQTLDVSSDSKDDQGYTYHYHWRVMQNGAIFAKGILGQYLYVDIPRNTIILRMGKKDSGLRWPDLFKKICRE